MSETHALRRPFLIGVLAAGIGVLLIFGALAIVVASTDDRPEGVAERWLTAVGDLTRKGVHDDAGHRADWFSPNRRRRNVALIAGYRQAAG